MPGEAAVKKGAAAPCAVRRIGGLEGGALGVELGLADIADGPMHLGRWATLLTASRAASKRARSSLNFG